jgi:hypothetical protein
MGICTTIKRDTLTIDVEGKSFVRLIRNSTMQTVELSWSEWIFMLRMAELLDWPVSPVSPVVDSDGQRISG